MSPVNVKLTELVEALDTELAESDALAKISEAQVRARTLSDTGDQLVGHYVALARAAGASWQQIGDAIGVSKQAAQQKLGTQLGQPTFERFTKRARAVVVASQEAARTHKHDYIGTEHLLIGLLGEPQGVAAEVLVELAGSADAVQAAVDAKMPKDGNKTLKGHIAFSPRSKEALEQTLQAALRLGHNYIGTEHILLGLLADPDSVATQALASIEITPEQVDEKVRAALAGYLARNPEAAKRMYGTG